MRELAVGGPLRQAVTSLRPSASGLWLLAWGGAVAGAAALAAVRLKVENPAGKWEPKHPAPAARLWAFTREQFGDAQVLLIGIQVARPAAPDAAATAPFEEWLAAQPEVASVFGPGVVRSLQRSLGMRLTLGRQLDELREAVLRPAHRFALVYASLHPPPIPGSLELQIALLRRLHRDGIARLPPGSRLFVAGKPAADVALNGLVRTDTLVSAPLALAVMVALLLVAFGRRSLGPCVGVAAAVVIVAGGLAAVREPLSTATSMTLPITAVVGLAYGIHMAAALERTGDRWQARRELSQPLAWAFATTLAALLSFALSPVPALRSYAYASSCGVALGYVAAYTLVPFLGPGAERRRGRRRHWEHIPFRLYAAAARRPALTAAVWAGLAVASVAGLARLRVEPNNYLGFFPRHDPTLVAHRTLDRVFGGSLPLFVLARADSGTAYRQAAVRQRLRDFLAAARRDGWVGPAFAPFAAAGRTGMVLEEWFEGRDPRYTRAVLSVPLLDTPSARVLLHSLDSLAAAHSDTTMRLQVTGPLPAGLPLLQLLIDSQARSLALTITIVAAALVVATRAWDLGLLLLVPNLLPLGAVGGAMGFAGIPLDFATVVVFSMVVGIAVDDTLQIAWAARAATRGGPAAFRRVAKPVSLTSLVAVAGFAALLLSPFPVTQRMGGLMALGLAAAWLADVTLTPLLVARGRRPT